MLKLLALVSGFRRRNSAAGAGGKFKDGLCTLLPPFGGDRQNGACVTMIIPRVPQTPH
jgi:hypothetical protein